MSIEDTKEYKEAIDVCLNKMSAARVLIQKNSPYTLSTLYGMTFIPAPFVETIGTSPNWVCAFNPFWLQNEPVEEVAGTLMHEVHHILRDYWNRRMGRDPDIFNRAADLPINADLRKCGWKLPKCALYPETYNLPPDKSTEEYYEMLLQRKDELAGNSKGGVCGGACGLPREAIEKLDPQYGRPKAEQIQVIRQTVEAIKSHAKAYGRGSVAGSLQEFIEDTPLTSRVRWQDRLARITHFSTGRILSGGDDFSLRRPSKRSYVRRLIRPGLIDQEIVPMFVIDTSLSMDMKQMVEGLHESINILAQLGIGEGWFMQADWDVQEPPKLMTISEIRSLKAFVGRGGTNFQPAFEAAKKLTPRPDLIFYFTDGDGSVNKSPPIPGVETIWCILPNNYTRYKPAPWGHVVLISNEPTLREEDLTYPYGYVED